MKKVKIFFGNASAEGVKYLEEHVSEWVEENQIEIKQISMVFAPSQETTTLGAAAKLYIILGY